MKDFINRIKNIINGKKTIEILKIITKSFFLCTGSIISIMGSIMQTFMSFLFTTFVCLAIIGILFYAKIKPDIDDCQRIAYDTLAKMKESDFVKGMDTSIYDKDNNLIGFIDAGNYEYVEIEKIGANIQNAYIAQEDKRFKEHNGVDWISTSRAMLALIKNKGEITQGGSTITQQVIKNTYLTQEKSFKRKLIEIILAPKLEMKFSKTKIMEYYCNTNYYGNRCYGIEAASQYYFDKSASALSISEAAMLAGVSNSPTTYDPVKAYDKSIEKRDEIIRNMYQNGFITEEEKNIALKDRPEIVEKEDGETFETYTSSYAIHCAAQELMKQNGFSFQYTFNDKESYDNYMSMYETEYNKQIDQIRTGGYKIYTSIDPLIQNTLQEKIDDGLKKFNDLQDNGKYAMQGAGAIADNKTGYVVAIVGGRGTDDGFNRAYLSARQPGSAIKPLIDYGPAFDTGEYYPSKIMTDKPIEDGPKNSGGSYRGNITIREALNRSINTIAWQLLNEVGINNGLDYLGKMEFQKITYIDNNVPALSIGGFTNGVRVVDMVKGYQTIANGGTYNDNTCVVKICDSNDNLIFENRTRTKQIYSEDTAYMLTDVLKGTINKPYGTGHGLALKHNIPAAGKTGTTNNNKDTWFCGYTPQYTAAIWSGYDIPRPMPGVFGSTYSGKIWKNVMDAIHEGLPVEDWAVPSTIYTSFYDPNTGRSTSKDTGLTDIFSKSGDIKSEELANKKLQEELEEEARIRVEEYENSTISGPEETYSIEQDFNELNTLISNVENSNLRKELHERVYNKYQQMLALKEDMSYEIALYEARKKEEEQQTKLEEESAAEEERLEFIRQEREQKVLAEIEKLEQMEYYPKDPIDFTTLNAELELLMDYDSYPEYKKRLENAINKVKSLPSYSMYQKLQQEKAEQDRIAEEERKNTEKSYLESIEDDLNKRITQEIPRNMHTGPGYVDQ